MSTETSTETPPTPRGRASTPVRAAIRKARRLGRILPCDACGSVGGYVNRNSASGLPVRHDGGDYGRPGLIICHACALPPRDPAGRKRHPGVYCGAPGPTRYVPDVAPPTPTPPPEPTRRERASLTGDPPEAEVLRLALELRRAQMPGGFSGYIEPAPAVGDDTADDREAIRESARLAIREGLASEAARGAWARAIVLPEPALEPRPARPARPAGWAAGRFRHGCRNMNRVGGVD